MITAKMPDGVRLAFDDGTPQSTIDAAARRYISLSSPKSQEIVVNMPEIKIPPIAIPDIKMPEAQAVKVEVVQEAPQFMKDLADAIEKQTAMLATVVNAIEASTKEMQKNLAASSVSVAAQMKASTTAIKKSADDLCAALTASKEVELDSNGNPVRISIVK